MANRSDQKMIIEVSTATVLKIFGVAVFLVFLWYIRQILILLGVVMILVSALSPVVDYLQQRRIPRVLAIIFIYFVLFVLFSSAVYLIAPPIISEIIQLARNAPLYFNKLSLLSYQLIEYQPLLQKGLENIATTLNNLTYNFVGATLSLFGGLGYFVAVCVLTFYLLLGKESLSETLISFFPINYKEQMVSALHKIAQKLGAWVRGQLLLCFIIGLACYIVLLILHIPYALLLAILAGVLEIIPTIGPILSAIPAILFAFTISPWTALIVGLSYLLIQQIESQLVVPKVMGRMVGVSPVVVIIALMIGTKLLGIGGAILAVPVAAVVQVAFSEWKTNKA
jgi:predicted PurR-regulated permease PerM